MTDNIGSLASLASHQLSKNKRLIFVPVYADFGKLLHQFSSQNIALFQQTTPNQASLLAQTRLLSAHLSTALARMSQKEREEEGHGTSQQNQNQTSGNSNSNNNNNASSGLSRPQWIFDLVKNSLAKTDSDINEFPGPMCVPLTRSNIQMINNSEAKYFVCEKSDGLRAIMVSVSLPFLPKWQLCSGNNNNNNGDENNHLQKYLSLRDTTTLEAAFAKILDPVHNTTQQSSFKNVLDLSVGSGELKLHETRDDLFYLVAPSTNNKILLRRTSCYDENNNLICFNDPFPRHATFFIDRSLNCAYLLVEDLPLHDLSLVIADGELIIPQENNNNNNNNNQLIFTTFDFYNVVFQDGTGPEEKICTETMTSRYRMLGEYLIHPLQRKIEQQQAEAANSNTTVRPRVLKLVRKEMIPVTNLPFLLKRLSKSYASQEAASSTSHPTVLFDGVTLNDGLIFTPDKFDLYPGSCMDQFKWKWPDCLSVDWVIKQAPNQPMHCPVMYNPETGSETEFLPSSSTPRPVYCEMFWYFKKRAEPGRGGQPTFGHPFAGYGWFHNPNNFPIVAQYLRPASSNNSNNKNNNNTTQNIDLRQNNNNYSRASGVSSEGGSVVECSFMKCDPGLLEGKMLGMWKVERSRPDKTTANAVTAVLSVMESVAEDIDIFELADVLCYKNNEKISSSSSREQFFRDTIHSSFFSSDNDNNNNSDNGKNAFVRHSAGYLEQKRQNNIMMNSNAAEGSSLITDSDAAVSTINISRNKLSSCYFLLCVVKEGNNYVLSVQWRVSIPPRPLTCNHVTASNTIAFIEQQNQNDHDNSNNNNQQVNFRETSGARLENILTIALANDGGSVGWTDTAVRAKYDSIRGKYVIVELCPSQTRANESAWATQVLQHLLFTIWNNNNNTNNNKQQSRNNSCSISPIASQDEVFDQDDNILRLPTVPIKDTHEANHTNDHYDSVASHFRFKDEKQGGKSERSAVRNHNGWIKQVLLSKAIKECDLGRTSTGAQVKAALLDLCSGRGGDIHKYSYAPIKYLMMIDASLVSTAEAARRYCHAVGLSLRTDPKRLNYKPGLPTTFAVADCFNDSLIKEIVHDAKEKFHPTLLRQQQQNNNNDHDADNNADDTAVFDLVSCQFSFHYSCSSEARLRGFLRAVSSSLRPGGIFFGTTVDDRVLAERRAKYGDKFGNSSYSVEFLSKEKTLELTDDDDVKSGKRELLSEGYIMHLEESVQGAMEYVVPYDTTFTEIALEEGLLVVMDDNFEKFFEDNRNTEEGRAAFATIAIKGGGNNNNNNSAKMVATRRDRESEGDHQQQQSVDAEIEMSAAEQLRQILNLKNEEKEACWLYRVVMLRKL